MANEIVTFKNNGGFAKMDLGALARAFETGQAAVPQTAGGDTQFLKMAKHDGVWTYGRDETEVEPDSEWAINPLSLQAGYINWGSGGKPLGKVMAPIVGHPAVTLDMLPNVGGKWEENVAMTLLCMTGEDKGLQVEYTQNSYGGKQAFGDIFSAIRLQISKGDASQIVPVVVFEHREYDNQYGKQRSPVFRITRWMGMDVEPAAPVEGPKGAPPNTPPSAPSPNAQQGNQTQPQQTAATPPTTETAAPTRGRRFNRQAPPTDVQDQNAAPANTTNGAGTPAGETAGEAGKVVQRRRRRS